MNPGIKRYLDEHGATYTPEALLKGLVDAGYDPAEVDAALRQFAAEHANAPNAARRSFGRWAGLLHLAALVGVFVLVVALKGTQQAGVALLGSAVLGVALLIGWAVSSMIGRALLPRAGVTTALIVPAISALLLGGACFGLLNAAIPTPPRDGTMQLAIEPPLAFEGSSEAACYLGDGTVQVNSRDLRTADGRLVTVFLYWYGQVDPGTPAPVGAAELSISIDPSSPADRPVSYTSSPNGTLTVDAGSTSGSGTMQFEGLSPEVEGEPGTSPDPSIEPISGTVRWTCE